MHYVEEFLKFEFASEILLLAGVLLLLVAVLKILSSGIRMLIWVVVASLGAMSVAYGMKGSGIDLPYPAAAVDLDALLEPGREISTDVLRVMCERLEESIGR